MSELPFSPLGLTSSCIKNADDLMALFLLKFLHTGLYCLGNALVLFCYLAVAGPRIIADLFSSRR